jgi:hypothetical protein
MPTQSAREAYARGSGGYGITVITGACGALNQGSTPCSRPLKRVPPGTFFVGG